MSFETKELYAIRSNISTIPEENVSGINSTIVPESRGLFLVPSIVPGRPDVTDYFLSAYDNNGKAQWVENPASSLKLNDLVDVDTTGVLDGEVIIYDTATQTWIPGNASGFSAGDALDFAGNVLNVLFDNTTITVNGLDQLTLVNDEINVLSTDGINVIGSPVALGGVVTVNVDNTVIRTTGGQTINGSLALDSLIFNDTTGNDITFAAPNPVIASYNVVWPDAQGLAGTVLENDGAGNLSWVTPSGSPGGPNESIQYNDGGAFNGSANFIFDGTDVTLTGGVMSAASYTTTSDINLKENIIQLNPQTISTFDLLQNFKKLNIYSYELCFGDKHTHYGFLAQELRKIPIFEPLVTQNNQNHEFQINYTEFIPWICELLKRII